MRSFFWGGQVGFLVSSFDRDFQGCLLTKMSTKIPQIFRPSALLSLLLSIFGSNRLVCSCTNNMSNLKDCSAF